MLEIIVFCGVSLGLLMLIKPLTELLGTSGILVAATLIVAWLLFVISIDYVPTKEEFQNDLDGLGAVTHDLFNWCFGMLYGIAGLITCWRAGRDLVHKNKT